MADLEFLSLRPADAAALGALFAEIIGDKDDLWFHPHRFTPEDAEKICSYAGLDLYCVARLNRRILGYAMLRGWDEGFAVPSLGIIVRREARRMGLGTAFMRFLHDAAQKRGATRIRLKVYKENTAAVKMYEKLGYQFDATENGQLVGYVALV